jgi:hypothetical protein
MTVTLHVVGLSPALLAEHLAQNGWTINAIGQYTSQRSWIVGSHENPHEFVGFGVSDGTRIMKVVYEDTRKSAVYPREDVNT